MIVISITTHFYLLIDFCCDFLAHEISRKRITSGLDSQIMTGLEELQDVRDAGGGRREKSGVTRACQDVAHVTRDTMVFRIFDKFLLEKIIVM